MNQPQQQQQDASLQDIQINNPQHLPQDTVSDIQFNPQNPQMFACSTWDGKIHIYQIAVQQNFNQIVGQFQQVSQMQYNEPITCIAWRGDGQAIYAGCGDNSVVLFNLSNGQSAKIGQHQAGIRSIFYVQQLNGAVITCSFDTTVCFWSEQNPNNPLAKIQLKGKIFAADCLFPILALGLQGEVITFINLQSNFQNLSPHQINYIDSPLGKGSQINSIKIMCKGNGFGLGSIDGRANLGKLTPQNQNNVAGYKIDNIMTFKCHKNEEKQNNVVNQILYPVNSICFNPRQDQFLLTCGSDGNMYFWDFEHKNKIKSFAFNKQPISACNVSSTGQFLAYSLGYDWHMGYEHSNSFEKPKICVHIINDDELRFRKN
ncbi:poly(A)+ RNA export protein (macronuclear) [Tetrahymena thermophila SB210]|uniref:Poly(A)+ RNA export protein n=1 Tax=Tetrahymena thermophila (strain SB210) TaxID=312017 RepID=Q22WM6_TETTS|nr:poly(A)+ RNA export protein [Tetrahymena thermophila SB210]EAR89676.1 poly(A)+ RNA export protein [Tetrahymena thermophila SB210]|eukprot:XP_001009921.1 poly(A)+ RNA export protein [Tetrahymena thermophila SB210]